MKFFTHKFDQCMNMLNVIVEIDLPDFCCGRKVEIIPCFPKGIVEDGIKNPCDHMIYYRDIWTNFVITPINIIPNKQSGHKCSRCKIFNEYAESNQSDGTYLCYSCRC
jgi:hypothetical protein